MPRNRLVGLLPQPAFAPAPDRVVCEPCALPPLPRPAERARAIQLAHGMLFEARPDPIKVLTSNCWSRHTMNA
jgi:hypothetical protein